MIRVNFSEIWIKGKKVRVSGDFESSEFELSRFYCIPFPRVGYEMVNSQRGV